jgi:hypothetical protein
MIDVTQVAAIQMSRQRLDRKSAIFDCCDTPIVRTSTVPYSFSPPLYLTRLCGASLDEHSQMNKQLPKDVSMCNKIRIRHQLRVER